MRRLFILLILLCSFTLTACAEEGFSLSTVSDGAGGVLLSGYSGTPEASFLLPDAIDGLPVTGIADGAFVSLVVDSLSLPRSIRSIGKGAFRESNVREIRFSHGLTEIGDEAFASCVNLVGCAFPETLTTVGDKAFEGCTALLYVTLPESVSELRGNPFEGCTSLESLPMVNGHPYFRLDGGSLISLSDGRVICSLNLPEAEEEPAAN